MKYLVWREHWRSGSLGGLYKIDTIHEGEDYEIVPPAPDDLATIGDQTMMPDGSERLTQQHIAIFRLPDKQVVNTLAGDLVEVFEDVRPARILQSRLTRVAEVMDS